MFTRRSFVAAGLSAPLVASAAGALAAEGPPSLDELLRKPILLDARLSPDGQRVALLREQWQGGTRLAYLRLARAGALEDFTQVALGDFDVEQVEWSGNDRLLIWALFDKAADGKPTGIRVGDWFLPIPVRRLVSVGADGSNPVVLFSNRAQNIKHDFDLSNVVDLWPANPGFVVMQVWNTGHERWVLFKVDVRTGEATELERGEPATELWYVHNGVPVLRYDVSASGRTATVFARAPGETAWKSYRRFRRDEFRQIVDFDIVGGTPDPDVLLVRCRLDGDAETVVRPFNLRGLALGEVLARQPGRDISGVICDDAANLVAAQYTDDRIGYVFPDANLAAHYRGMNAFFDNLANVELRSVSHDHARFVTEVSGPTQAGAFHLYDRTAKTYAPLGEQRPWLKGRLAGMETLKVKARDGLELTAYLTVPQSAGTGRLPMVVMPHGGPQVRDAYEYDTWAQALAAQGWLVLQPNFRGSGGYGRRFAEAGHRHWGDAMQWDVEDCVAAVVASGRADPARLAILGASYGGYAAMMGAILRPDLYRCVISRAGPDDLLRELDNTRREDGADSPAYAWWTELIGDPRADEDRLRAASPRLRAAEMKPPLLLFHGVDDRTVEVEASRDMDKAMRKAGRPCEYVEVKGEGHRGWRPENEKMFLERSIGLIRRSIA